MKKLVRELSREKLEEYSSKIRRLLDEAKYCMTIPGEESYNDETLKKIDEEWKQVIPKLEKAKNLVNQVLNLITADDL